MALCRTMTSNREVNNQLNNGDQRPNFEISFILLSCGINYNSHYILEQFNKDI